MKQKSRLPLSRLVLALAAVLLLAGAWAAYRLDTLTQETTFSYVGRHSAGVGQLTDVPVTQTFTVTEDSMTAVEVMFSNYNAHPETGTLVLTLSEESGTQLAQQSYEVAGLKNMSFLTLTLDAPVVDAAGKTYVLSATSDCTEGEGVTLRIGARREEAPEGTMTLQDGTTDTENFVNMRTLHVQYTHGWEGCYVLLALAVCCLACLPLTGKEKTHA